MIADLKPYPAYKDSGVPWLGKVPEHWDVRRLKWVSILNPSRTEVRSRLVADMLVAFLPMERVGADGRIDVRERVAASSVWNGFTYFKRNDVLVAKITPCFENGKGACLDTLPTEVGFGSTEFHVLRGRSSVEPQFLYRLTTLPEFRRLGADAMTGAAGQQRVPQSFVANFTIPLPPISEQAAIVSFLDHVDRRIRRYIRAKQKLIKLLEEQKQAMIHRAVTRGLDPNVRLKPSGVEWLGDVPEHWKLERLKDVAVVQTGLTLGKNYKGVQTESRPYLRVANVQVGRLDLKHVKYIDVPTNEANGATLRAGDVLMTEGGDIDKLGRGCVWRDEIPGCLHQNHIFAVRCRKDILVPEFLVDLMGSRHGRAYFQLTAKQTTNLASTNSSTLRAFPVFLPPLVEQQSILDEIARQTAGLAAAIGRAEGEIELLREYRTRLIADVVTGKLDVREAEATLPDETDESEPLDEAEALPEGEQNAENEDLDAVPEGAEA